MNKKNRIKEEKIIKCLISYFNIKLICVKLLYERKNIILFK